jgi:hypothetical protein
MDISASTEVAAIWCASACLTLLLAVEAVDITLALRLAFIELTPSSPQHNSSRA